MSSIDSLLAEAQKGLKRLNPAQAAEAVKGGALLIDTRPYEQRNSDGEIPGAIVIDRNVLEWRLDPRSPDHIPEMAGLDESATIIVICREGYSSSLAAASLQRLGLKGATDVIGGFQAWAASGQPVRSSR
jgi:rhodanese-related sulfurtransferase